ncbi:WD40 repeat domain-containing protein [Patescibacteria group bacterium]|nr:WD40 repeat domain-containing protein [Patescibacteria group bacterium]
MKKIMSSQRLDPAMAGKKIIFILLLPLLFLGASCFSQDVNENINQAEISDPELFFATINPAKENILVDLYLYNLKTDSMTSTKTIELEDWPVSGTFSSIGANQGLQYNESTGDIYILTNGYDEFDGSCMNADGSCYARIYKTNLDSGGNQTEKIIEFETAPQNWILNPQDNSLIFSWTDFEVGEQIIKRWDLETNEQTELYKYEFSGGHGPTELVLSPDGRFVSQVQLGDNSLNLLNLDIKTKISEVREIDEGNDLYYGYSLSPDGKKLAYYSGDKNNLMIYNLVNNKKEEIPYTGEVGNYNLFWNGAGDKLMYILDNGIKYYDFTSQIENTIQVINDFGYVFLWSPSDKYAVYQKDSNQVLIYDFETGQNLTPTPYPFDVEMHPSEITDMQWTNL